MAGTKFLSLLSTTATLRILAREMVGLQTLSVGTNLLILGLWTEGVGVIAFTQGVACLFPFPQSRFGNGDKSQSSRYGK